MATTNNTTHEMVVTRKFAARLEQLWQAWSDSDYVKQWWGQRASPAP
jgi:uncharacterized protein YndB with AHSA1/START domain